MNGGTLAEVHASDDMKSLYYGEFEATYLLYIGDEEVGVWGGQTCFSQSCLSVVITGAWGLGMDDVEQTEGGGKLEKVLKMKQKHMAQQGYPS